MIILSDNAKITPVHVMCCFFFMLLNRRHDNILIVLVLYRCCCCWDHLCLPEWTAVGKLFLVHHVHEDRLITTDEYNLERPAGSRAARLYGLPKLHKPKENYPLRPVMSGKKTVGYGLGKMLTYRLSHLRKSPYVIKDTRLFEKSQTIGKCE